MSIDHRTHPDFRDCAYIPQRRCAGEGGILAQRGINLEVAAETLFGWPRIVVSSSGITIDLPEGPVPYYRFRWLIKAKAQDLRVLFAEHGIKIRRSACRLGHECDTLQVIGMRTDLHVQTKHKGRSVRTDSIFARQHPTFRKIWIVTPLSVDSTDIQSPEGILANAL